MSRKVLINQLAEALDCKPTEIENVNQLTNKQIYWIIHHEKMHKKATEDSQHKLVRASKILVL